MVACGSVVISLTSLYKYYGSMLVAVSIIMVACW